MPTILEALKSSGAKMTKARVALAELFARTAAPLTAAQVGTELTKRGVRANRTTVYRELEFLREAGLLETVTFGDRNLRYERKDAGHHHHVICMKCDDIADIDAEGDLAAEERRVARKTGFTVIRHSLEFFGLCARCK